MDVENETSRLGLTGLSEKSLHCRFVRIQSDVLAPFFQLNIVSPIFWLIKKDKRHKS